MGTRSTIAIEKADGTVKQIYCHYDGYPSHNGKILLDHYSDPSVLAEIIEFGAIRSLYSTIEETKESSFAYLRGEDLQIEVFKDFEDYKDNHAEEEYEYILRNDGKWYVKTFHFNYNPLETAFGQEEA